MKRVKLEGEYPVDVAREYGCRHQSRVCKIVKRLEQYTQEDNELHGKLDRLTAKVCSAES